MRLFTIVAAVAALGLVSETPAVADEATEFQPMDQFVMTPLSPPPAVDRSDENHARCAGMYAYAARMDEANAFAKQADALLMNFALSRSGAKEAGTLLALRDQQLELTRNQQHGRQQAVVDPAKGEQAATLARPVQSDISRLGSELGFTFGCLSLVKELTEEGVFP